MNKPTTVAALTTLRWSVSFLVLLFLPIQMIPRALGQRDAHERSSDGQIGRLLQHEVPKQQSAQPPALEPAGCSSWAATGSLNAARDSHTATLLPNGMVLAAGGFGVRASSRAQSYTIPQARTGRRPALSTPLALSIQRRCFQMAWCLLQGDSITVLTCPRARSCTIRQAGPGPRRAASIPRAVCTRRHCYLTEWYWLREEPVSAAPWRTRNCTIRQVVVGLPRDPLTSRARSTPRPCCQTGWCWS